MIYDTVRGTDCKFGEYIGFFLSSWRLLYSRYDTRVQIDMNVMYDKQIEYLPVNKRFLAI
jgi:hypothetical protein